MALRTRQYLPLVGALAALALVCGCAGKTSKDFIGSAVAQSQTYQVATTAQGNIVALYSDEGLPVKAGDVLAIVDTVPTLLRREELKQSTAQQEAGIAAKRAEIKSNEVDLAGAEREYKRAADLVAKGSLPGQQADNLQTVLESAKLKIEANRKTLEALLDGAQASRVRIAQLNDQLSRSYVKAPAAGVVLTRYRNLGEVVGPGNPLFEVGAFDTLTVDFFVPQTMLALVKYGQPVRIRLDSEGAAGRSKEIFVAGVITWVSDEAEFSPKNIQTRESRNELAFRVRATVPNPQGLLKRGLPVEVWRQP
jgi:HlyD family secretion protein